MSEAFQSDMEKLLFEKGNNYFIHILPSVNNGTLFNANQNSKRKAVINKYIDTISSLKKSKNVSFDSLTFYICTLKPFSIITNKIFKPDIENIQSKLVLEYQVSKEQISIMSPNWIRKDN